MTEESTNLRSVGGWGMASRAFCVFAGIISIVGGLSLFTLKAASENSLIEALAHGIGIYCIGKGLFMMAATANFTEAVNRLLRR